MVYGFPGNTHNKMSFWKWNMAGKKYALVRILERFGATWKGFWTPGHIFAKTQCKILLLCSINSKLFSWCCRHPKVQKNMYLASISVTSTCNHYRIKKM